MSPKPYVRRAETLPETNANPATRETPTDGAPSRENGTQGAMRTVTGSSTHVDLPVGQPTSGNADPHAQARTWTITIPAPFVKPVKKRKTGKVVQRSPWLNSNDRDHWRTTSPIRKDWRNAGHVLARVHGLPRNLGRVRIDALVVKPRAGRYDAMNFYPTVKPVVDGLVDYGLVADDDNSHVLGPFLEPGGKGPDALVVTVTELA